MIWLYAALLALLQGLTEFLPISSSGHLVLFHALWPAPDNWPETAEKILDIAVHLGTLVAVMIAFRGEVASITRGFFTLLHGRRNSDTRLFLLLTLSSLPVIVAGGLVALIDITLFDHILLMAWMTLIFGFVLIGVDFLPQKKAAETMETLGFRDAMLIGLAQILALMPGVSRSGITMIVGRGLGYSLALAARFSMLLGLVAISGAGTVGGVSAFDATFADLWVVMGVAAVLSCLAALIAIRVFLAIAGRFTFTAFGFYRVLLGGGLILFLSL